MIEAEPLIIGGGPAGSAAAIHLCRAGARPVLYEREPETVDALCGGFLSWTTLDRLEGLGLRREELGGPAISSLRLVAGRDVSTVRLPAAAMAVSRQRLDRLLLEKARELGAELRHGSVRFEKGTFTLQSGQQLCAQSVFLATGKHELRGLPRPRDAAGADPYVGLRAVIPCSGELASRIAGHIEMHLFAGGYAGVVLRENGAANVCMAVRKSRLAAASSDPAMLFRQLADQNHLLGALLASLPGGLAIDAIGRVPYGWRARATSKGLFRLGDQAAVIPSIAGEGIGVALASAELAVRAWREHGAAGAPAFQRQLADRLAWRLSIAALAAALGTSPTAAPWLARALDVPGLALLIARATRL